MLYYKKMKNPFIIYYQTNPNYTYIKEEGDEIFECIALPSMKYNCFYIMQKKDDDGNEMYPYTIEGLFKFRKDFIDWTNQLSEPLKFTIGRKQIQETIKIDYTRYFTHNDAVRLIFFEHFIGTRTSHGKDILDQVFQYEPITIVEERWFKNSNNGGLIYYDKSKSGDTIQSYGYDYKNFYLYHLSHFTKAPVKSGKEIFLTDLPNEKYMPFGFYKVKISCTDENFFKLFNLSKNDVYTNYSLDTALKYEKLGLFGVKVELIIDENPNAYIYNKEDIKPMSSLFSFYYDTLIELQNKYPKNLLIKHLKSSLWGQLSKYNKVSGPEEKFYNKVYTSDFHDDDTEFYIKAINKVYNSDEDYLTSIPKNKIYKYNFRFKPFLISYIS